MWLRAFVLSVLSLLSVADVAHGHRRPTKLLAARQGSENVKDIPATLDDSCNFGYCSVFGAAIGGWGGELTVATTLEEFEEVVSAPGAAVVVLSGQHSGNKTVTISGGKTVVGAPGSSLTGVGLLVADTRNLILRNFKISAVHPSLGAAISIVNSTNVWVDHCDLSGGIDQAEGGYSPLLAFGHGGNYSTVSYTLFHDHYVGAFVSTSDGEDEVGVGEPHITFGNNQWVNLEGSAPSYCVGTGHIFNSLFQNVSDAIGICKDGKLLVESCVFEEVQNAIFSAENTGTVATSDLKLDDDSYITAPEGDVAAMDIFYPYDVLGSEAVKERIVGQAGQTLEFREGEF